MTVNPNFSDFYEAQYSGDTNFPAAGTSGFVASVAVTGSDFSLVPLQPNTLTLSPGNSGTVELLVGVQTSTAPVSFGATACSGLPKETTCTVSPTPASTTGAVNVQILTTAPHAASIRGHGVPIRPWWPVGFAPLAAMLLCSVPRRRTWRNIGLCVIGVIFAILLGCGGGSSNGGGGGGGGGGNDPGTPAGSYSITVTGTSGSYTHSTTFTLVVQ
jgi:hypothetical protein